MDVLGRAVSAFRQSVSKSKSSGSLANSEQCDDNSSCSASIASMHSSTSISSYLARRSSHSSATSSPTSRMSYLRRLQQKQNRRSKSATRPVLCGNRVSQMTRAYDDIEAVTRLLEEKEKDLELTAHIGKDLLTENTRLKKHVEELENDIKVANENCQQLKYELNKKCNLLAALTNDDEAIVDEEETTQMSLTSLNLDLLQKKISTLEHENKSLRTEATQMAHETDDIEEQERRLIIEWKDQLNTTRDENNTLLSELERLREENKFHSEAIEKLTTSLTDSRLQIKHLTDENDKQIEQLSISNEIQSSLAMELVEFKARYQEVLNMLEETQKELRNQRKRAQPTVRSSLIPGITALAYPPGESLQSELMESSLFSDHSLDSGIASDRGSAYNQNVAYKKAFEMARNVNKAMDNMSAQIGSMSMSSSLSQPRMSSFQGSSSANSKVSSIYGNSTYPASMGSKTFSHESLTTDSEDNYPAKAPIGVPGTPGAKDLEAALKRLTPAEVLVRRTMLSNAPPGTYCYEESLNNARNGFRTPDSIMSTGSSNLSSFSSTNHPYRKKLELVMPMEGSHTLHHWNRLATPSLDGLFEERPGVKIRGGRGLDEIGLHTYSLSDVEEDETEVKPGKQFQMANSVYTYTTSTVMHPDDGMSTTSSLPQSQMSSRITSVSSSRQPSIPSTPHNGLSRRNSCSTYSVSAGLASMLNERGIKAVTPSALNTPMGQNHSPTVTPLNTPEGSPTRDRSPEPPALLTGLLYSGADMIRRKLVGSSESPDRSSRLTSRNKVLMARQKKRALGSLGLMEKVESIGLDNIMHTSNHQIGISPLAIGSVRTRTASPMTQLTSLRHRTNRRLDDPFAVDIETVRAVLSKGLSNDSIYSDITTDGSTTSSISNRGSSSDSTLYSNKSSTSSTNKATGAGQSLTESNSRDVPTASATKTPQRLKQMQRQKSRRSLLNGGGQRPDLGTVAQPKSQSNAANTANNSNNNSDRRTDSKIAGDSTKKTQHIELDDDDDGCSSVASVAPQQSLTQSFVGSISSLFFGRKGGLL